MSTTAPPAIENSSPTPDEILPDFHIMLARWERFIYDHWFIIGIVLPLGLLVLFATIVALAEGTFPQVSFTWTDGILTGWFLLSILLVATVAVLAYTSWVPRIPVVFRRLVAEGRLLSSRSGQAMEVEEMIAFTDDYRKHLYSGWRYVVGFFGIGVTVVFVVIANPYGTYYEATGNAIRDALAIAHMTLMYVIGPLVWAYFLGIGAWTLVATSIFIRRLTPAFVLNIQPSHPDHSGGLKFLASFCQLTALPVLVAVLTASVYGIGGVVTDWIVFNRDVRAIVLIANASLVLGTVLAFVVFLWPLWDIHLAMLEERRAYENEFANRAAQAEKRLRGSLAEGKLDEAKAARDELDTLQAVHPDKIGFPTWPFDQHVVLRFLTPQVLPLASLLLGSFNSTIRDALLNVLKVLFGGS